MGSLCSKTGTHSEEAHVLVPSSQRQANAVANSQNASRPPDPRTAAAAAAEQRLKTNQARGTHASNPKQGMLATQAAKPAKFTPEPKQEERLVWD